MPLSAASAAGTVIVDVNNADWGFLTETGAGTGQFVEGPAIPPLGNGSAELTASAAADGVIIGAGLFQGTRLDTLTTLTYETYRISGGAALAPALQLNIDYDLTDGDTSWQGRLVYEPYNTGTNPTTGAWESWDALAASGRWWASGAPGNGVCPISAPCSLATVLANFPDAGVHSTLGAVLFKAGSGWTGFQGNVDNFVIGVSGDTTTFDFEPFLPVHNLTQGTDHPTIQDGIDNANPGDVLELDAVTFTESSIRVDEAVTIQGQGKDQTFVEEAGQVVFYIDVDGVVLKDLTIQNSSQGVRFEKAGGTIDNTEINNVQFLDNSSRGIEIHNATTVTDLRIIDSCFTNNITGIRMASSSTVDGLSITGTVFDTHSLAVYQANDGGTSTLRDLHIDDSEFYNSSNTAVFAEEIRDSLIENSTFTDNNRGVTIFKHYTGAGVNVENVEVSNNTFNDSDDWAFLYWQFGSGLGGTITVADNTINQDVGVLDADYAQIDIRLDSNFTHAPVVIERNEIYLSGTFTAATAAHGIKGRGGLDNLTINNNTLDGGGVGDTGGVPPSSGIFLQTDDGTMGAIPTTAVISATKNEISGFVNGVSVYDPVAGAYGGLMAGASVNINRNSIASNSSFGAKTDSGETIDVTCNWWGTADGPSGEGLGSGDSVSSNATFAPWLMSADLDGDCIFTPELSLEKSGDLQAEVGDTVVYTLDYENLATATATDVMIEEIVPVNTVFNAGASTTGWNCAPDGYAGSTCTFDIGILAGLQGGSILFAVDVLPDTAGLEVINQASITEISGSDDQAQVTTLIIDAICDPNNGGNVIMGTPKNDNIKGTAGPDIIYGLGGNDRIEGLGGDDCIIGGDGNDKLYGNEGNDFIIGQAGNDSIWGGDDDDFMRGNANDDRLQGDDGDDTMYGDERRDKLYGNDGNDIMWGGDDRDTLDGGDGNDDMHGGDGDDHLNGKDGNDDLHGDDGRDKLYGGYDNDLLRGGAGDDTLDGSRGEDDLYGDEGRDQLNGGHENDELWGGSEDDRLYGGRDDDRLHGEGGDDRLYGSNGDDFLDGGADTDRLDGGSHFDECVNGENNRGCEVP